MRPMTPAEFGTWIAGNPLTVTMFALNMLLIAVLAIILIRRERRRDDKPTGRFDRWLAQTGAILGTAASADGIWAAFAFLGVTVAERLAFFAVLELGFIIVLRRARRTLRETAADESRTITTGRDGPAALAIILTSGLIAALFTPTVSGGLLRLAISLVAGWIWWGEISQEIARERAARRRHRLGAGQAELSHDGKQLARIRRRWTAWEEKSKLIRLLMWWRIAYLQWRFDTGIDEADIAVLPYMREHLAKNYLARQATTRAAIAEQATLWGASAPLPEMLPAPASPHFPHWVPEVLPTASGSSNGRASDMLPTQVAQASPRRASRPGPGASRNRSLHPVGSVPEEVRKQQARQALHAIPGWPEVSLRTVHRTLGGRWESAKALYEEVLAEEINELGRSA